MTATLAELVLSGGGLEGASAKQVRAILEKLQTLAVVVEHRSIPSAQFSDATDEPCVFFFRGDGGENSAALFSESHLSARRSMKLVREAMAAHAVITSATGPQRERYDAARETFLRQCLEKDSVVQGGAQSLSAGAL